jgi:hypothetical protein
MSGIYSRERGRLKEKRNRMRGAGFRRMFRRDERDVQDGCSGLDPVNAVHPVLLAK